MQADNLFSAARFIWIGWLALVALILVFGAWAVKSELSGAIIVQGLTEIEKNRQVVEHPEGGVVSAIFVDEGDSVNQDQPLIQLDSSLIDAEIAIVEQQVFELMARRGRLISERDERETVAFDVKLEKAALRSREIRQLKDTQNHLFFTRRSALQKVAQQRDKRSEQIKELIAGLEDQNAAIEKQLVLLGHELADKQKLLKKGLAKVSRVRDLQMLEAELLGQIGELKAAQAESAGRLIDLQIEATHHMAKHHEQVIASLQDVQLRELELLETLRMHQSRLNQLTIRAPLSGRVFGMSVFAEKSVVSAAEPMLFIVPQDRPIVISAPIEPNHVDLVYLGQEVLLKLATHDQHAAPDLAGEIVGLSADIFIDKVTGQPYYRAEIHIIQGELAKLPDDLILRPGMPVESFIKTRNHTPLAYLIEPFTKFFGRAMRES